MQPIPHQGSIADVFLPRLIARLHRDLFDGALRVNIDATIKAIYFKGGEIASAASNADGDRLQSLLIQDGRLTLPQVEMAKSRLRPGVSLGKVLIEMGFLTPSELLQCARRQVHQIVASCFIMKAGAFKVDPGPLPPEVTVLGLPTKRLLFDSLMLSGDREWVVQEMGSMESVYRPTVDLESGLAAMMIDSTMEQVAKGFDGECSLRELSSRTSLDDFTVSKIALALEILGMVEPAVPLAGSQGTSGRTIPVEIGSDRPTMPPLLPEIEGAAPAREQEERTAPVEAAPPRTTDGVEEPPWLAEVGPAPLEEEALSATVAGEAPISNALATGPSPEDLTVPPPSSETLVDSDSTPLTALAPTEEMGEEVSVSPPPPPIAVQEDAIEEEEEPPPFPPEDLPAFAVPPNAGPRWSVDPETGEHVHLGPVEVVFDGRVGAPRRSPLRLGGILGLIAALAIVVVAILLLIPGHDDYGDLRARFEAPGAPEAQPAVEAEESPRPESLGPARTGSSGEEEEEEGGEEDTLEARRTVPESPETSAPASDSEEVVTKPVVPAMPSLTESPSSDSPRASPPSEAPVPAGAEELSGEAPVDEAHGGETLVPGTVSPLGGADAYDAAMRQFDTGDLPRAAKIFQELANSTQAHEFTLQLMIACEPETLERARASSGEAGLLYFLPLSYKGRDCYRACWGIYPDQRSARGSIADLPPVYASAGIKPIVVPMSRLRPPG